MFDNDISSAKNYYEILEVPTNANAAEIQKSYIMTRNTYAGDNIALYSVLSKEECQEMLIKIDEAYSILGNPQKRREYDKARGLNVGISITEEKELRDESKLSGLIRKAQTKKEGTISKMVANQKFSLQYEIDSEMEKKIEMASEFTGTFLKEIREYKGVDIARMAAMTRISATYIECIENEDFVNLPASVYVRGFVFQYAKCLKLNPDLVANSFLKQIKTFRGEISQVS